MDEKDAAFGSAECPQVASCRKGAVRMFPLQYSRPCRKMQCLRIKSHSKGRAGRGRAACAGGETRERAAAGGYNGRLLLISAFTRPIAQKKGRNI